LYKKISAIIFLIFFLFSMNIAYAQPAWKDLTQEQKTAILNKLTPEQQKVVQAELLKSGGSLTPDAIEVLKRSAEFKDLKQEEIILGKELLEKSYKPEIKTETAPVQKKTMEESIPASLFERSRLVGKYQDIPLALKPFGYDFFKDAVTVLMERKDIPVPTKYVIGPGDEVKILLWGRVNAQYNLTVDRNGSITVPSLGPLYVAGMTFEQMSTYLIKQTTQIVGANIDITMGALKTIPVFILGDVKRPGAYNIGSFATITDALLLAGGPSEIGSMRNIQLKRKDQVVTTFDLYNLLLKGDKSADYILQAGDVVFVPVSGTLVGVAGNVKRPAIYELKDNFTLQNAIDLAGGILPSAYTQQIQISRIQKNDRQIVVDVNDKQLQKQVAFNLQDADLIKIFTIVDKDQNSVYLEGNVKKPGRYEFRTGMKISDLIKNNADLLDETHYDYALVKRFILPQRSIELVPFNLGKVVLSKDQKADLELHPEDHIYIFSKWLFKDKPFISIEGEIRGICSASFNDKADPKSGVLTKLGEVDAELKKNVEGNRDILFKIKNISDELKRGESAPVRDILEIRDYFKRRGNLYLVEKLDSILDELKKSCKLELADGMKVRDAILNSGGITNNTYLEKAEIIRVNDKKEYSTLYFDVAKALVGDVAENLSLQHKDKIIIHSNWEYDAKKIVYADGEVSRPGVYQFTDNMKVSDLIFKAGILESAYLKEAELASQVLIDGKAVKTEYRKINLQEALAGNSAHNIVLKPYDRLMVKRIANWKDIKFAEIGGEVNFAGRYVIKKGDRLSSLIERAGGYTDKAYLRGAVFKRESVRQLQQKSLEEITTRLEKELLIEAAGKVSTAFSTEEIQAKQFETVQKKQLIENMKKLTATGRMTIKLAHLRLLKGSEYDIELEDGDTLLIPEKNSVVSVNGAVMGQGSYIFSEKADYLDYIAMSGGFSNYADTGNVFILKVDGSARRAHRGVINWNEKKERAEFSAFSEAEANYIEPGDVIVVPEKLERIAWLREIRDITQILMNTAVAAGVVIKLF